MAVKERRNPSPQERDEAAYAAEVGARIVASRREVGLTQVELAELVGASQRAMQGYENGERVPYRLMAEIARIVNKPMAWLLHGDKAILDRDEQLTRIEGVLGDVLKSLDGLKRSVRELSKKM